jgi:hypothetical protein
MAQSSAFFHPNPQNVRLFIASFFVFLVVTAAFRFFFAPQTSSTFDSGSVSNREIISSGAVAVSFPKGKEIFPLDVSVKDDVLVKDDVSPKESAPPESQTFPESVLPPKRKAVPSKLSFSFRPDSVKLDDRIFQLLRANLLSKPFHDKVVPLAVTMDAERTEPRGQLSGNELILSATIPSDSENLKVLVHELGHVVDIHYLKPGITKDVSNEFYAISWDSYKVKKRGAKLPDFVSGYALSNKYEDFAESFTFFVFHNDEFKKRSKKNSSLAAKYAFFSKRVFLKDEFASTSFASKPLKPYLWDSTKPAIDVKKYLFYLK